MIKYFPLTSQTAPSGVPSIEIEHPGSASPVLLSLATPEILPVVPAKTSSETTNNKKPKPKIKTELFLMYFLKGNPPLNTNL